MSVWVSCIKEARSTNEVGLDLLEERVAMRKVECPGLKLRVGSDGCGLEEVFYGERDEGFRIDEDAVNIGDTCLDNLVREELLPKAA
jgi:hypothetical protein